MMVEEHIYHSVLPAVHVPDGETVYSMVWKAIHEHPTSKSAIVSIHKLSHLIRCYHYVRVVTWRHATFHNDKLLCLFVDIGLYTFLNNNTPHGEQR